jgi:DNA-binding CsgD family transcriptional regulator
MQKFLTFDIDRAGGALAAEDADLPDPTLTVVNPATKHAHMVYVLSAPVCTSIYSKDHPRRYLEAIKAAYIQRLGADMRYTGLITQNPWNPAWDTLENGNAVYDLSALADYVTLPSRPIGAAPRSNALGRNCTLFDGLRFWAYKAIRAYWGPGGAEAWHAALAVEAERLNVFGDDKEVLDAREVKHIVKSVWRWTWRTITPGNLSELIRRTHTPEQQRARVNKRWAKASKKEQGLRLIEQGLNNAEVARTLGVDLSTVKRWKRTLTL